MVARGAKRARGRRRTAALLTATIALVASGADGNNLSTYTFPAASFGDEAADRVLVLAVGATATINITAALPTVTVDGNPVGVAIVAQGQNADSGSLYARGLMYAFSLTAGTSGDVVIDWGGTIVNCGFALWRVTGISSVTPYTTNSQNSDSPSWSANIASADSVIAGFCYWKHGTNGYGYSGASLYKATANGAYAISAVIGTTTVAWTGLTEDFDATIETSGSSTTNRVNLRAVFT